MTTLETPIPVVEAPVPVPEAQPPAAVQETQPEAALPTPPPDDVLEVLRSARWYVSQASGASKELLLERIDALLNAQ